jgi:hypothetical protein
MLTVAECSATIFDKKTTTLTGSGAGQKVAATFLKEMSILALGTRYRAV